MSYSRREFLAGLSLITSAAALSYAFPLMAQKLAADHYLVVGSELSVCAINLKTRQVRSVPIGFQAHGFAQNPLKPERIWAIEKWGASAAELDFRQQNVTRRLTSPQGTGFFGHGIFMPQGDTLFIVQTDLTTGLGHLIGYDAGNFQPVKDYQVAPGALHDCHLLPDGTFLVVSHGSTMLIGPNNRHDYKPMIEKSSLVRFDPKQGRVLEKKFIEDKDQMLGHFAVTESGSIIALALPRPESDPTLPESKSDKRGGAVYFGKLDMPSLKRISVPEPVNSHLRGEVLSIAVNEAAHLAVVTNPESKTLMFIDTAEGKYLGNMQSGAYGVSYDSDIGEFICSGTTLSLVTDGTKDPVEFPVKTLQGKDYPAPFGGSHSTIVKMENI